MPFSRSFAALGTTTSFHTLHSRLHLIRACSANRTRPITALSLFVFVGLGTAIPWRFTTFPTPDTKERAPIFVPAPLTPLAPSGADKDVADIAAFATYAGGNPDKQYVLIGPRANGLSSPQGYNLLVVLPGGDGGPKFSAFVRRLYKHSLSENYIVAELVAKRWDARQFDNVVWPTQTNPWPGMRFSTEQFASDVVDDVEARFSIDRRHVYTLAWASGGPAAYAASLYPASPVKGSFIAMSTFPTDTSPSLSQAKGQTYFLLHPENTPIVPVAVARRAETLLRRNGATVQLVTYPGDYGWSGDVYGQIRRGMRYLEHKNADERDR